jgi:outer membrane protein assembly factor BamB
MKETTQIKRSRRYVVQILFLAVLLLLIGVIGFSCVQGLTAIGWSGGAVSENTLFVGTKEGRLIAINLTDDSRQWAAQLTAGGTSGGLFGCMPAGGGCSGASGVAIYGTPAFDDELVYIAGYNGRVYAYAKETLATRWVYPRDTFFSPIVGGIVVSNGSIYFGGSDGYVYALDANTGDPIWNFPTGDDNGKKEKIWATPAVSDGTLYIGSFDKNVYAVNTADGTIKWKYLTEGTITATPLVIDGTVYIASHDRYFYALNAADGTLKWKFMGENWFWAKPAIYEGKIYAGCLDDKVYVLDAATGDKLNEFNLEGPLAADPVIYEDNVIFATREGTLYSISATQNALKQLAILDDNKVQINGPLAINDGIVYIHTQDLILRRVNAETGAILGPISLTIGE